MGILSWLTGSSKPKPKTEPPKSSETSSMNGAVEVIRPPESVTIFEFGSIAASVDKVTMAGYCPVSDDLQPCRWEILPSTDDDAPQFRVVF